MYLETEHDGLDKDGHGSSSKQRTFGYLNLKCF